MTGRVHGACHCRAHRFTAPAPASVTRCTCSICSKRGNLAAYYAPEEVTMEITSDLLTPYQWGDRMMTFFHCAACGCPTHAESPEWSPDGVEIRPARLVLNARLFEEFDLDAVPVVHVDGKNA